MSMFSRNALLCSSAIVCMAVAAPAYSQAKSFDVPAQSVDAAIGALGRQADIQIVASSRTVRGKRSNAVRGDMTVQEALTRLLAGTGLSFRSTGPRSYSVVASGEGQSQGKETADEASEGDRSAGATPEILVVGTHAMNTDIRRTEDDTQPYVVFNREDVQRSHTSTLEDFFKTRLPMNTTRGTISQTLASGARSQINLRGLGANQTLILVDGRRMPSINDGGADFYQPDINGIPLAAVERIEILPSTASGIYGGGATGGVVNIITRKDYSGADVSLGYDNAFRGDAGRYRISGTFGFTFNGGRTRILVSGSREESNPLLVGDRDFAARGRALLFANNPDAIFGLTNPPVSSTANIRSDNRSNLVLKPQYGGTALNSPYTFVPVGYAGVTSDNAAGLVANAGKYNLAISNDVIGNRTNLLPETTVNSAMVTLRHQFSDHIEVYGDFSWLDNESYSISSAGALRSVVLQPSSNLNPFTTAIRVGFPSIGLDGPQFVASAPTETLRATGGVIFRLPKNWVASADVAWGKSRKGFIRTTPALGDPDGTGPGPSITTAYANGLLDVLRDQNMNPLDYSPYLMPPRTDRVFISTILQDYTFRLTGPLVKLPGGPLTVSGYIEARRERSPDEVSSAVGADARQTFTYRPSTSQNVLSYYAEARVPLISSINALPFVRSLELQFSARRDEYTTRAANPATAIISAADGPFPAFTEVKNEFSATKYTVGGSFSPVDGLMLRASYGTGFLAPLLWQIVPGTILPRTGISLIDPKRGSVLNVLPTFTQISGGNPNLVPEESASLSMGVVVTPHFLPGFRLSVDYTRIKKTNEINTLSQQQILDLEDLFPDRIIRDPLTAEDTTLGYTGGVIKTINVSGVNVSNTSVEAVDVQADYTIDVRGLGNLHFYVVGTYQPTFRRRIAPSSPDLEFAGADGGVLEWRGNAGINWQSGPWSAGWNIQYYDSYRICSATANAASCATSRLNQGSAKIPSQAYNDVYVTYRFGDGGSSNGSALSGLELGLGIQNIFDKRPPVVFTDALGGYSQYGDPRLRRFSLSLKKHF